MLTADEARAEVHQILTLAGIIFTPHYMGEQKNVFSDRRTMDKWMANFGRGELGQSVEFEFFTGLGNRKHPTWGPGLPMFDNGPKPRARTILHEKWTALAKPQAPHAADVLQSLLSESSAADQSFGSWCEELGYDTDSRKTLATYEACQQNADKMRRFFTREQLALFSTALQDY